MERLSLQSSMDIIRLREHKAYGEQKKKIRTHINRVKYMKKVLELLQFQGFFLLGKFLAYC